MDNLAHSLVGWALSEAGLKKRTGLATATLIIAANLPDIDVFGFAFGENLAFRRGITHGPLAMVLMVPALAVAMQAFDRWQARRGTRPPDRPPISFGWLIALSFIGLLSHPALDYLNVYGIRYLMPFSETWYYGDTLFIIDVWLWGLLSIGICLSRRRAARGRNHPARPAGTALALLVGYIGLMAGGSVAASAATAKAVAAAGLEQPLRVIASPPPLNPFRRQTIYSLGDRYGFGEVDLLPAVRASIGPPFATHMADPAIRAAAMRSKNAADFLYWARLPFAEVSPVTGGTRVVLQDARFAGRAAVGPFRVETMVPDAAR